MCCAVKAGKGVGGVGNPRPVLPREAEAGQVVRPAGLAPGEDRLGRQVGKRVVISDDG